MEKLIEWIFENVAYLAISFVIVICNLLGKPKTAEKLRKALEKKKSKLEKQVAKDVAKAEKDMQKLKELESEVK